MVTEQRPPRMERTVDTLGYTTATRHDSTMKTIVKTRFLHDRHDH